METNETQEQLESPQVPYEKMTLGQKIEYIFKSNGLKIVMGKPKPAGTYIVSFMPRRPKP